MTRSLEPEGFPTTERDYSLQRWSDCAKESGASAPINRVSANSIVYGLPSRLSLRQSHEPGERVGAVRTGLIPPPTHGEKESWCGKHAATSYPSALLDQRSP